MANYICECDYKPRLVAPSEKNKYFIKAGRKYGGYNQAMLIDKKTGSVLPDCTGCVHGLWLEDAKNTNYKECDKLHLGDAKNYYKKNDGYERGQEARVGAVACWEGGEDGHVAYSVEVDKNKSIKCAMSEHGGNRWYYRTIKLTNGTYDYKTKKYNWHFQGFIYNPYILRPIGKAKVITNNLRIRQTPSVRSKIMGHVVNGKTYDVYQIKKNQGYTWYRIGTEKWIADNGKWVKYSAL